MREQLKLLTSAFLRKKQDEMTKFSSETEGIKRDIAAEQEKHEHLTLQLHRTQGEIESAQKELERIRAHHEEMRAEYAQAQRVLNETERNLENANSVGGCLIDLLLLKEPKYSHYYHQIILELFRIFLRSKGTLISTQIY